MSGIPGEAVEAAARALYTLQVGPWVSGRGVNPGGTPWGTSREREYHAAYVANTTAALSAALPAIERAHLERLAAEARDQEHKLIAADAGPSAYLEAHYAHRWLRARLDQTKETRK